MYIFEEKHFHNQPSDSIIVYALATSLAFGASLALYITHHYTRKSSFVNGHLFSGIFLCVGGYSLSNHNGYQLLGSLCIL